MTAYTGVEPDNFVLAALMAPDAKTFVVRRGMQSATGRPDIGAETDKKMISLAENRTRGGRV